MATKKASSAVVHGEQTTVDMGIDVDMRDLSEQTTPVPARQDEPLPDLPAARLEYTSMDGREGFRDLFGKVTIGRHTENDIQLLDPEVSKYHLVLEPTPEGYQLTDLGSANGTILNGRQIMSASLSDGDVIIVGHTRLRFQAMFPPALMGGTRTSPFDAMLQGGAPERTMVTLVPSEDDSLEKSHTNVFSIPMTDGLGIARSKEGIERDYERLRVAFDLALLVGTEHDLARLSETILGRILEVCGADTAVIMLRAESGELVPLASRVGGRDEVRIPRAIVEKVIRTRQGLLTSDAQLDHALRSSHTIVGQRIRSAMCVPLVVADDVVGIIHLSSSSAAGAYEERDLELLRAIAQPAGLAVKNARLMQKVEEDARMRADLSRFLSPALVERVVKNDISVERTGDTVEATVLFTDIRGFTSMSAGARPDTVVSMLNEYFEAMVEVVFAYGGTLDKFIGDGMMAVWGTPEKKPDDPLAAVRAADQMRHVLEREVNRARVARGDPPLTVGYGVATGPVIAGAMGARRRQDFTVIGDTVNLSSRLCGRATPGQILVCERTQALCGAAIDFDALPPQKVKGIRAPVPVFAL